MKYSLDISDKVDNKFKKMERKHRNLLRMVDKKVAQIRENPEHFKPLRGDLHGARRVHVAKSFVLIYEINEEDKVVRIIDFDHHDKIY